MPFRRVQALFGFTSLLWIAAAYTNYLPLAPTGCQAYLHTLHPIPPYSHCTLLSDRRHCVSREKSLLNGFASPGYTNRRRPPLTHLYQRLQKQAVGEPPLHRELYQDASLFSSNNRNSDPPKGQTKSDRLRSLRKKKERIKRIQSFFSSNGKLTVQGHMLAGALSRSIAQTAVHPLACVKTLQQVDGSWIGWHRFLKRPSIWYRGALAQFLFSIPQGALNSGVVHFSRQQLLKMVPKGTSAVLLDFCSQASATFICSIISSPQMVLVDRITAGIYANLYVGMKSLLRSEGIPGLYVGWLAGIMQKIPSYGMTWALLQQFQRIHMWLRKNRETNSFENFLLGALASGVVVTLLLPFDTAKTRIVTQLSNSGGPLYEGVLDCIYQSIRKFGIRDLYGSLPMRLASVVPMMGIQSSVFELIRRRVLAI